MPSEPLNAAGWRVMTVWECALRGRGRLDLADLVSGIKMWIRAGAGNTEISTSHSGLARNGHLDTALSGGRATEIGT
jgi:DNA mismatch endonuclease (patch repair protein)